MEVDSNEITLEYEKSIENEESTTGDKQLPRRMITETGDIVEAPIILESSNDDTQPLGNSYLSLKLGCKLI